ncbi:MAG: hypothetical protein ACOY4Q_14525 [Bacillota bacterium]
MSRRLVEDKNHLVLFAIFLLCLFALAVAHPKITSDGYNYFAYLRSAVFDGDLDFHNDFKHFRDPWFWKTYLPRETPTGHLSNVFSVGPAILWAPFYLVAHGLVLTVNLFGGSITADGFSRPYVLAVLFGSVFYAFLGFVLTYRLGKTLFRPVVALFSTVVIWLASFLLYYMIFEPSMSHAVSFFTVTLFIWYWHITRPRRSLTGWLLLGLAAGLMMLVRWQNGIFMLFAAIESVIGYVEAATRRDWRRLQGTLAGNIVFLLAAVMAFLPQLLAWKILYGAWLTLPQGTGFMKWDAPFMMEVWFSSRHGLFSWTPAVYPAVFGWLFLYKKDRQLAGTTVATFLVMTYANSIIADWWAGWGFGMRRFDGFLLPFTLGLGSLLDFAAARYKKAVPVIVLLLSLTVAFNFYLLKLVRSGAIHRGGPVNFAYIFPRQATPLYSKTGYPFSFPANWLFSLRYGLSPARYDTLAGAYIDDTYFYGGKINLGSDRYYLGAGWSANETAGGGVDFSRSVGKESVLYVPVRSRADYRMRIRMQSLADTGNLEQKVTVLLDKQELTEIKTAPDWAEYTVEIPREALKNGINLMRLQYANTGGVAVDYIRFEGTGAVKKDGYWK